MNKLKTFFYVFKKSISSPEYYKELLETKFSFTFKYYLMLAVLVSLIFTSFVSIKMVPETKAWLKTGVEEVKNIYPDDLVISIKDGKWSINKPEPYIIPMPQSIKEKYSANVDNAVVFYKQGTINDFSSFKTFALVNESNILTNDNASGIKAYPVKDLPNADIDKSKAIEGINNVYKYIKYVPFLLPLVLFVGQILFDFFGYKLMYILWIGLAVYLLSLLKKKKINFLSACRIGIHTMTLPIIVETLFSLFSLDVSAYPWFFVLNTFLSFIVLDKMFKEKEGALNPKN
ncbi:DUF1189 family protein [candidate division WWE3 bacterium]|uniref:DUF1189 family protein n=1 Tax=candidate division WWE3 bacterium TaxID=2053526 RepID=A0A7X9E6Q1_UNCKA|nr:DUF1189 family protein [candidate division WWE3 bacterium]